MKIFINEIFTSIDGEINGWGQGRLTTFIRMTGCNLRCSYCDSKQTWNTGNAILMDVEEVVKQVEDIGLKNVTITGGEPLLQRGGLKQLISLFCVRDFNDYSINIETNGSMKLIYFWSDKLCYTIDYKLGVDNYNFCVDIEPLLPYDTIKFVIANKEQYNKAVLLVNKFSSVRDCICKFAFSPTYNDLNPKVLMNWMIEDKLDNVLLNCQLHKYLKVR